MTLHRHPTAHAEARHLVGRYDGSAEKMVDVSIDRRLEDGEIDQALELDRVRRAIKKIYQVEGK